MSNLFNSYRFSQLQIDILPNSSATEVMLVVGYSNDVFVPTPPTTADGVLELACSAYTTPNMVVPTKIRVPKRYLLNGPNRWYKTNSASTSEEGNQGDIIFITSAACTGTFNFVLKGVCEFADPILSGESIGDPAPEAPTATWSVVTIQPPTLPVVDEEKVEDGRVRKRSVSLPPKLR